jgi:hypothetical protein
MPALTVVEGFHLWALVRREGSADVRGGCLCFAWWVDGVLGLGSYLRATRWSASSSLRKLSM